MARFSLEVSVLLVFVGFSLAQDPNGANIGMPPNGVFSGSSVENVQVNNGNLHVEIPLYSVPGRGLNTTVSYVYDSRGWIAPINGTGIHAAPTKPAPHNNLQWAVVAPLTRAAVIVGVNSASMLYGVPSNNITCPTGLAPYYQQYQYTVYEPNGTGHDMGWATPASTCYPNGNTTRSFALDGSGWQVIYNSGSSLYGPDIISPDGTQIYGVKSGGTITQYVMRDRNGNQITRGWNSTAGMADNLTDTLGHNLNVNPVLNTTTGKYELTYYDNSGTAQKIIITKSTVTMNALIVPDNCDAFDPPCRPGAYTTPWQMPTEILLPNGLKYTIAYNQNGFGTPSSLTLPTGAVISYTYVQDDPSQDLRVASRTVTSNGQSATWTYSNTTCSPSCTGKIVTDPLGNESVYTIAAPQVKELDVYSGTHTSGTLMKKVQTDYFNIYVPLPIRETTTLPQQGNLQSKIETDYDSFTVGIQSYSYGAMVERREYGFGVGTPGSLVRKTHYEYAHISGNTGYNVSYLNSNLLRLNTKKIVYDGSGNIVAQATTTYDGTAVTATSSVPSHDYTGYGSGFNTRGNPTQSSVWRNLPTVAWLNTNNTYNDLGHPLSTADPSGHTTTFSYTDSWSGATCSVGTNTQAYLTQTSAPDTVNSQGATVHHRSQTSYYPCTGQKQSTRDENDILAARTGAVFTYDLMLRPLTVTQTDSGQTSYSYTDTINAVSATTTQKQDATHNIVSTSYVDGLGRVKQTKLIDPEGNVFADTTYDLLGRKATVSNPYRSTSDTTYGITSYQYDALSRVIKEIPPDGTTSSNNVVTAYGVQTSGVLGLTTTVTDQAGHQRKSVSDALGRLVDVWEPDPTSGSLVNETLYGYDVLNNLLRVDQKGGTADTSKWRTRTSTYDSLSRLLTTFNPESGTTTWTYDNDSNVLTKKDARNVTITYNYDQLHRVATVSSTHAKTYSNGDPAVDYFYDQTSYNGLTITEGVNQRTGMSDATGQAAWKFDTEGRALSEKKTVNITGLTPSAVTKTLSYTYNLDGSMASLTYPSGHVINYSYNTAGHAVSTIDNTGPINYVTAATYAPHGDVAGYTNGQTGSFTGIFTTNAWNNRFQPSVFTVATQGAGAHTVMSLSFNFNLGTADNGLLVKINNGVNTGRNVNYKYDQLNRIVAGWHDATDWGTKYGLDIWGNLQSKGACDGVVCPTHTTSESFTAAADGNNRFIGYSYDAGGNLLNDQLSHTFSYDGENRPYSAGGVTYYYDGEGERVAKSNGKLYLFVTGSAPVVETDASGNLTAEYVFFNGKRVAMRKADGSVHYYFADQIGSANVVTNATASAVEQDIEYHPYGEQQVYADTLGQQYKFTGKEHDPETNNDYFGARYYSSTFGRFLTPDWAATPVAIPYAVMGNPQTLNLYSYVQNNPITGTDPDGHCPDICDLADPKFGTYTQSDLDRKADTNIQGAIGVAKGLINLITSSHNEFITMGESSTEPIPQLKASNPTQQLGIVIGTVVGGLLSLGEKAPSPSTIERNAAKGAASEARVLEEIGQTKNTKAVTANGKKSIPDFQDSKVVGEIKDKKVVSNTKQLKIQKEAAQQSGREHQLITGTQTKVTENAAKGTTVIRRDDLGPKR